MDRLVVSVLLCLQVGSTLACSSAASRGEGAGNGSDPDRSGSGGRSTATGGAPGSSGGASGGGGTLPSPPASTSGGAAGAPTADAGSPDAGAEPAPPSSDAPVAGPPAGDGAASSGLVKIFDGTSFDNWEYDPKAWVLKDGAMHGNIQGGQSQAFTKKDYSNFRLIVWSRMTAGNDHLGICFWGSRPGPGKFGFGGCLLVIPPNAAIWDYLRNQDHPKPNYQVGMSDWHKTEILANRTTGRVLVAVNGKLLHEYQDPPANLSQRKNGPVGMQIHKAGAPHVEYKDIEIEVDPPNQQLITLTP